MATLAFLPLRRAPAAVAASLQEQGIGAECGHFYALRTLQHLGLDPAAGVVRLSLVHYNSEAEVGRLLAALERAL